MVHGAETADDEADGSSNELYYALNINGSVARGKTFMIFTAKENTFNILLDDSAQKIAIAPL